MGSDETPVERTDETLRARKKAATRRALHEAALRLAMAHGLDGVTVEAIADEANVSRRTFSNYFANKEDALLYGDRARVSEMVSELRARPVTESVWAALRASAVSRYRPLDELDPEWFAQLRLVRRHTGLLAQQMAIHFAFERELADEISRRLGDPSPLQARVIAATFLAMLRTATTVWLEDPGTTPLSAVIDRAFDAYAPDMTR